MTTSESVSSGDDRRNVVDHMAGFLAVASMALSVLSILAQTPALLAPIAAIIAFAAARMSPRNEKLAMFAMAASLVAFVVGMSLAVVFERSLL